MVKARLTEAIGEVRAAELAKEALGPAPAGDVQVHDKCAPHATQLSNYLLKSVVDTCCCGVRGL